MRPVRQTAVMLLVCGAAAHAAEPVAIDAKKSELVVKTTKEGLAKGLAHNHVVIATDITGKLSWDPAAPETLKVAITVKTASLVVDDPAVRKRYGEPTALKDSDRKSVTETMLSDQQLDARRYPLISFVSLGAKQGERGLVLSGQLTLHGVTKNVSLPVTIATRDGVLVGEGTLRLRTSDFGIKPYSTGLGTIRNSDQVELIVRVVAAR